MSRANEFMHFITDNFSTARVVTVLVHTYIATLIYEIVNPLIFLALDPYDKLRDLYIKLPNEKKINLGRVLSELITIIIIFSILFYLHKKNKM